MELFVYSFVYVFIFSVILFIHFYCCIFPFLILVWVVMSCNGCDVFPFSWQWPGHLLHGWTQCAGLDCQQHGAQRTVHPQPWMHLLHPVSGGVVVVIIMLVFFYFFFFPPLIIIFSPCLIQRSGWLCGSVSASGASLRLPDPHLHRRPPHAFPYTSASGGWHGPAILLGWRGKC